MVRVLLKKTGRGFVLKNSMTPHITQIKVNKSIEILKVPVSEYSKGNNDHIGFDVDERLIKKILIMRYQKVSITTIQSKNDLDKLVLRKPDLVFSGVKYFNFKKEKIWLNDFLKQNNISHITSSAKDLQSESNKSIAKDIIRKAKIITANSLVVYANKMPKSFALPMPFPVFVKPLIGGNSKGVDEHSVVVNSAELKKKIKDIQKKYNCASIVETYLRGKEYTVGIIQDTVTGNLIALPAEIIIEKNKQGQRILDFKMKKENTEELIKVSDKINDEDMLFVMPYPSQGRASAGKAVSRRSFTGYWEYHVEKPIYVYPMNESWAGTPVLSDRGEVLGIGSLYISDSVSPGIMSPGNLFVPINILKPIMKDLIKNGRRTENINPYMGLSADDLTGILNVARVSKKGPAEQSGIQAGDLIISVNGTPVKSMEEFYKTAWKSGGPGTKIKIKVQRDKKNIDYELKSIDRMDYFVKNKGL